MSPRMFALVIGSLVQLTSVVSAGETGTIRGQMVDERGHVTYVGNAAVFLCDAQSGMPLLTSTKEPLAPDQSSLGLNDIWIAVTTDRGAFEFKDVPIGNYRLVAQSWSGTTGMADFNDKPSTFVLLHGVADGVAVSANQVTTVYPRKLGDGVLKIINDPEEPHAFLLVSRNPRLGDGVLGPAAWGTGFITGLIGITQMEKPYVTLIGLPDDQRIHVGLFNYDNNPGVGGDSYTVGRDKVVRLQIYATWSNGKYEPPERLAKLTDYLAEKNLSVSSLVGLEGNDTENRKSLSDLLTKEADRLVQVADIGEFRLADVLAASRYCSLREFHRHRRAK